MTEIAKFLADAKKIVKTDRQKNKDVNFFRIENDLRALFARSSLCKGELPSSVFEFWEKEYVFSSVAKGEVTDANLEKLAAFLAFLCNSDEFEDCVTDDDWAELARLTGFEAEELPVSVLQDLMAILVSKGAY